MIPPRFLAAALIFLAVLPVAAQERSAPADTTLPPALLAQFRRDAAATPEAEFLDLDSVAVPVTVSGRHDLDGDGADEVVLDAIGRFRGASGNCSRWIYRPLHGGWKRIFTGGGLELGVEEERVNGFLNVVESAHFSAYETYSTTYSFDGERYAQSAITLVMPDADGFTVSSPVPARAAAAEPRMVTLAELPIAEDAAVSISADYATCLAARATPGLLCGTPRLLVTGGPAGCVTLVVAEWGAPAVPVGDPLCPVGRGGGVAVLHPSPAQWDALTRASQAELRAGGASFPLAEVATSALQMFIATVHSLNGIVPAP
ncbi:MAG TPA: hypothetical protein VE913_12695 [Longimicrobium sp.]|nr:hypothetical protein [Longimicrobium sp.]